MKAQPTIGIVSPGDMGHALGAFLVQHGLRVLTNLQGRSPRTVALAAQAGMIDVADNATLVREANLVLSVLIPAQAAAFAEWIAAAMRATHCTRCSPTATPSPRAPRCPSSASCARWGPRWSMWASSVRRRERGEQKRAG
jgi:hypothetical protein